MNFLSLRSLVTGALLVALSLASAGCSQTYVSTAAKAQTAELLKDAAVQAMFPEKVKNLSLAMIDDNAALPEFNFSWDGLHGIYQGGGQQFDVFVLERMNTQQMRSLVEAMYTTAKRAGDNVDRLRFNNGTVTFWSQSGLIYRVCPLDDQVIVFRTSRNVSELPLSKDYLRQRSAGRRG